MTLEQDVLSRLMTLYPQTQELLLKAAELDPVMEAALNLPGIAILPNNESIATISILSRAPDAPTTVTQDNREPGPLRTADSDSTPPINNSSSSSLGQDKGDTSTLLITRRDTTLPPPPPICPFITGSLKAHAHILPPLESKHLKPFDVFHALVTNSTAETKLHNFSSQGSCQTVASIQRGENKVRFLHSIEHYVTPLSTTSEPQTGKLYVFQGDCTKCRDPPALAVTANSIAPTKCQSKLVGVLQNIVVDQPNASLVLPEKRMSCTTSLPSFYFPTNGQQCLLTKRYTMQMCCPLPSNKLQHGRRRGIQHISLIGIGRHALHYRKKGPINLFSNLTATNWTWQTQPSGLTIGRPVDLTSAWKSTVGQHCFPHLRP